MDSAKLRRVLPLLCVVVLWAFQGFAAETAGKQDQANSGMIEIECNISQVALYLCPEEKYQKKETSVFFGLIKSEKFLCSKGEISLGVTPVKPVPVPPGKYVLLVPSGYRWEKEGPIEIDIENGKRRYFLLKLFSARADGGGDDHGAGGGSGGGPGGGASEGSPN
jgi:hypothetical protein